MPLASMLEMNKPFLFASSRSDETSTEQLASPTNKNNNGITTLPRPPSMDHTIGTTNTTMTKLPSTSLDRGLYYSSSPASSSISPPSDLHHHDNPLPPPPHLEHVHPPSTHQDQQPPPSTRLNGYHYPIKTSITTTTASDSNDMVSYPSSSSISTSNTLNSHLLSSPSTPTTVLPPPPSSSQQQQQQQQQQQRSSSFSSHLPTHHHRHQLDTSSISLPAPLSHNESPPPSSSSSSSNSIDQQHHQHHSIKKEPSMPTLPPPSTIAAAATLSTTPILVPPPPPLPPTDRITIANVAPPPPLLPPSLSKRPAGHGDEGDSGYFDSSATDNRRVKRRKELNQRIDALNHDFLINKERIFAEKLLLIQNEVNQAHNNTHTQYKEGLILLESIRQKTIEDGRLLRDYQTQVTDNQFTLEIHRAEEEYLAEKHEVREKLFAVLEEKRRKLKEDKDNCDLAYDVVLESQTRMNKRNLRKRGMENGDSKLNKRKQVSGPALVFRLKDEEVYDDLQAMRNGLSTQTKKSSTSKKK